MSKRRRQKVEFSVNVETLSMNAMQTSSALGLFPYAEEATHFLVRGPTEVIPIQEWYSGAVDPRYARKKGSYISR
jgi:hypothetical protein